MGRSRAILETTHAAAGLAAALALVLSCDGSRGGLSGGAGEGGSPGPGSGGFVGSGGWSGSGGTSGSAGPSGTFTWSADGGKVFSNAGFYSEQLIASGGAYEIWITSDYSKSTIPCWLKGQFPAVPPPVGNYSIVDRTDGRVDGTFVGGCSTTNRNQGVVYVDPSVSGTVTLTASSPELIEGAFMMRARPLESVGSGGASGSIISYTGSFSVGCEPREGLCGLLSISSP